MRFNILFLIASRLPLTVYGAATSHLPIVTPYELHFIEAESQMMNGDATAARSSLEDANESHMTWLGVDAASIATYADSLAATTDLELIMNEKYGAMFTLTESWTDWRRIDFPSLSAPADANLSEILRRLPYPEGESLYNADNISLPLYATLMRTLVQRQLTVYGGICNS